MTNEKMLKKLESIKKGNTVEIDAVIEEVKVRISLEKVKSVSEKDMVKSALKLFKSVKTQRPALGNAYITEIDGVRFQYYTDSYIAVLLKGTLPVDTKEEDFLHIEKLIPRNEIESTCNLEYKKLVIELKQTPLECGKKVYKVDKLNFNGELLKFAFKALGSNELTIESHGENKPAVLRGLNGFALLVPLRCYN